MNTTVLEIGAGNFPWCLSDCTLQELLPKKDKKRKAHYIVMDINKECLSLVRKFLARLDKVSSLREHITVTYVNNDSRSLCLSDASVDTVIISNVLSLPSKCYCSHCGKYEKKKNNRCAHCNGTFVNGLTDDDKHNIFKEALRVLCIGGVIKIHNSMTPRFANNTLLKIFEIAKSGCITVEKINGIINIHKHA